MKSFLPKPGRVTHIVFLIFCLSLLSGHVYAQSNENDTNAELPMVRVLTNQGAITMQLRPDVAPKTVENFLQYARDGFYKDTIFHRVIPGFMIQGGGFTKSMKRKETRSPIDNEASPTLPNLRGTIAMARTRAPDSATSQFFINVADNDFLNAGVRGAGYAVFGKVTAGMGVVDEIAGTKTAHAKGMADVPVTPVRIESITVLD